MYWEEVWSGHTTTSDGLNVRFELAVFWSNWSCGSNRRLGQEALAVLRQTRLYPIGDWHDASALELPGHI